MGWVAIWSTWLGTGRSYLADRNNEDNELHVRAFLSQICSMPSDIVCFYYIHLLINYNAIGFGFFFFPTLHIAVYYDPNIRVHICIPHFQIPPSFRA
jgi:hypothetical protein